MILDEIITHRKEQLAREKAKIGEGEMKKLAEKALSERTPLSLAAALKKQTLSCICEVKKASPSKGLIRPDFRPADFAKEYEAAGANAISCLTEEHYFQGSSQYLADIRKAVKIPILRKDFIFDEYQMFEAAAIGADAVLLIAAEVRRALQISGRTGAERALRSAQRAGDTGDKLHRARDTGREQPRPQDIQR
mgnify:CR=1 FL=1